MTTKQKCNCESNVLCVCAANQTIIVTDLIIKELMLEAPIMTASVKGFSFVIVAIGSYKQLPEQHCRVYKPRGVYLYLCESLLP